MQVAECSPHQGAHAEKVTLPGSGAPEGSKEARDFQPRPPLSRALGTGKRPGALIHSCALGT